MRKDEDFSDYYANDAPINSIGSDVEFDYRHKPEELMQREYFSPQSSDGETSSQYYAVDSNLEFHRKGCLNVDPIYSIPYGEA